ncbi:multicystatin-like [Chenopodium quinoa]|uniref:Cysteine proteinase inhibitor n=1 Tax=Chenopodium quinoa TaxID=63459 RepID=A0A803LS53_CHEQI|nr:multicystatin-like [Chenopodium quinoa]
MMNSVAQQKNIHGPVPVDPNSPKIQEVAAWALNEHNKEQNGANLVYERVLKAEQELVDGVMYYIDLEASVNVSDGNMKIRNKYYAKVFEQDWTDTLKLEEFKPLLQKNEGVAVAN